MKMWKTRMKRMYKNDKPMFFLMSILTLIGAYVVLNWIIAFIILLTN